MTDGIYSEILQKLECATNQIDMKRCFHLFDFFLALFFFIMIHDMFHLAIFCFQLIADDALGTVGGKQDKTNRMLLFL